MYVVMWNSLFSRFQKGRVFTWNNFLQMVKNISVHSFIMHFLKELVVDSTLVLKGHSASTAVNGLHKTCLMGDGTYFQHEP
jgi:hypothetical protein